MALNVATGNFTSATTTGNKSETGVGFQPKAIIFFGTDIDVFGTANDIESFIGFATSSTKRGVMARRENNGETVSDCSHDNRNNRCCLIRRQSGASLRHEADFVSFDADGFTLNWITVDSSGLIIFYVAIGGDDLTDFDVGQFTKKTSTGNDSITGIGFQPDIVLLAGVKGTVVNAEADGLSLFFGSAISSASRMVTHSRSEDGAATSNTGSNQKTDRVIFQTDDAGTLTGEADFVSQDADGFTLDYLTADGNASQYMYLALKGGSYNLDNFNANTSLGNQAVAGLPFAPKIEVFPHFCSAASGSEVVDLNLNLGAAVSSTERSSMWSGAEDGQSNSDASMEVVQTHCLRCLLDPTPLLASADFVSQDSAGFTVDWDTVDAISRQILFLAMGDAADGVVPKAMHQYRRRRAG